MLYTIKVIKKKTNGVKSADIICLKTQNRARIHISICYGNDKFALWIDLGSTQDNQLHGTGKIQMSDKNDITLAIQKKREGNDENARYFCMLILCQTQELISRTRN